MTCFNEAVRKDEKLAGINAEGIREIPGKSPSKRNLFGSAQGYSGDKILLMLLSSATSQSRLVKARIWK